MEDLLTLDCEQAGELWGSVWGERLWHWLKGEDFDMSETEAFEVDQPLACAGARRCGRRRKAWAVAHKRCSTRRRCGCGRTSCGRVQHRAGGRDFRRRVGEETRPVSNFGDCRHADGSSEIKLSECQDNQTLIAALSRLWAQKPKGQGYDEPYFIGVTLNGLVPDRHYRAR